METQKRPTVQEKRRRKMRRRKKRMIRSAVLILLCLVLAIMIFGIIKLAGSISKGFSEENAIETMWERTDKWKDFYALELERPELNVQLLTINEYSRPAETLPEVKNIFVHYTANKGTDALQNRSYFESLSQTHERSASAHFVIGYEGEIVQCIPTKEIAYAVKSRNYDSISIECCYLDESGKFTQETYDSLIRLTAWLLHKYELAPENVLRHYDEGGKNCPKYYVEHEEAWKGFIKDLTSYMVNVSTNAEN